jgi:hypothetical protein
MSQPHRSTHLKSLHRLTASACILFLLIASLLTAGSAAAQDEAVAIQKISGRLEPDEFNAYVINNLQAGDRLTVSMRATSGNLDPAVGIMDTAEPVEEVMARYQADAQQLSAENENVAQALEELRGKYFLAWNDDGGTGYAAALEFTVPQSGDYRVITAASLSALGRATFGDYELLVGLNTADTPDFETQPVGAPFVEREQGAWGISPAVEEVAGSISDENPVFSLSLADIEPGDTLFVYVEPTSGNLQPAVILRDYGGKPLEAANLDGQQEDATLQYTLPEGGVDYSLDIQGAQKLDGTATLGEFRALVGVNAPDVLTGQAPALGRKLLEAPIEVKIGLKVNRISQVNSQDENFTVLGSLRMDWTDPTLAFSPDSCNCAVKLYTEKEFDRFLADVNSRWPDFAFFNQIGNRWVQGRAAAIWPDGRARYAETFTTSFQADFDFRRFPFDVEVFPIYLDMLFPADMYTVTDLTGYSEIDPQHGEDEFIITDFATTSSIIESSGADRPSARYSFTFSAPRHLEYYVLQIFVPIALIFLISWFTFFLRDFTRRIEAAAANILLFIAFSFSLADNYPRLGYVTLLDALMAVTFVVNTLVLLYNVYMKRLENEGEVKRVERIDRFFDWAYPLSYVALIALTVMLFF